MSDPTARSKVPLLGLAPHSSIIPDDTGSTFGSMTEINFINASEVPVERIDWIWEGWLASGKLHILAGVAGTGKTTISLSLAATVSQGGYWPDGNRANEGKVVIWSGEDDHADTLVPRLASAGANLSNIELVKDVSEDGKRRPFDPALHAEILADKLALTGSVRLLIIDPIVSAVAGNGNANSEVRRGLQPLVDLAQRTGCAVLGITHFSKGTAGSNPLERVTGSLAFGAVARVVLVTGDYEEQEEDKVTKRVLCRAKSNIGPDTGGFVFEIAEIVNDGNESFATTRINWGNPVEGKASQLLRSVDPATNAGSALNEAKDFLEEMLSHGPASRQMIEQQSKDQGIKWATIRRAQKKLGIKPHKDGMHGVWLWSLPNSEDAQNS